MARNLEQVLLDEFNGLYENDLESKYEEYLNDAYGDVEICGQSFQFGTALKGLDPTAFRCGMNDWTDSEYEEVDGLYYTKDDIASAEQIVEDEETEEEAEEEEEDEENED